MYESEMYTSGICKREKHSRHGYKWHGIGTNNHTETKMANVSRETLTMKHSPFVYSQNVHTAS